MSADETQKCINGLIEFANYAQFVEPPIKPVTELWEIKIGLHQDGVAIKFNKFTQKVKMPHEIARSLAKQLETALSSYKNGFTIKVVNTSK